jgi:tripartite-type tricarboxylate transporter receptor subunit TctC
MKRRSILAASALAAIPRLGHAQAFPDRPVRIVVPYAPGGVTDTSARALGERLEKILGQPIIVENKAGGGTIIATEHVARSKPDGTTLLLATGALAVNASFGIAMPYDTFKDLMPVVHYFDVPILVAAHPESPIRSMADLAKLEKPLIYASAGGASMQHLWAEDLKIRRGLKLEHVGYKGSSEALRDVMAGHVTLLVDLLVPSGAAVKAGKLRGLAVGLPKRAPFLPDVPTVAEAGFLGTEGAVFNGLIAPAGTPPAVVGRLNEAVNQVLAEPAFAQRLGEMGLALIGGPPEAFGKTIAEETAKWRKVIQASGIPAPS